MTRVVVADDHPLVRRGVMQLLGEEADIESVAEAGDYAGIMRALRAGDVDVLILDIDLPGRDGIEILKIVRREFPQVAVLMYSMHPESEYGVRALRAGAAGYVAKSAPSERLVEAVRTAAEGRKYINAELALALAERVADDPARPGHELLSDREFQTMKLIASGMQLSGIAIELGLSPKTVSVYRARVLEKLRLRNNAELTHYAIRNRLVG